MLPHVDRAFSALVNDLEQRGLLDSTLVVMMGEMGRTPKVNAQAGRDHWSMAQSILFAGGGVKPGQVIGATDKQASAPDWPIRSASRTFCAPCSGNWESIRPRPITRRWAGRCRSSTAGG